MPSGFYSSYRVPGNNVANALGYLEMAVRANPRFIVFSVSPDAGLGCVGNAAFDFFASDAHSNRRKVKLFRFRVPLATLWAIVARH